MFSSWIWGTELKQHNWVKDPNRTNKRQNTWKLNHQEPWTFNEKRRGYLHNQKENKRHCTEPWLVFFCVGVQFCLSVLAGLAGMEEGCIYNNSKHAITDLRFNFYRCTLCIVSIIFAPWDSRLESFNSCFPRLILFQTGTKLTSNNWSNLNWCSKIISCRT